MKWTKTNVIPICILLGFAGFLVGKGQRVTLTSDEITESSPQDHAASRSFTSESTKVANNNKVTTSRNVVKSRGKTSRKLEDILYMRRLEDCERAMHEFVDALRPEDFSSASAIFDATIKTLGENAASRQSCQRILIAGWAKADPMAALHYVIGHPSLEWNAVINQIILPIWMANDPAAALAWTESQKKSDARILPSEMVNPYLEGVIKALAFHEPNRATELLHAIPPQPKEEHLYISWNVIEPMIPYLLKQESAASAAWIAKIPNQEVRDKIFAKYANELLKNDPAVATAWLHQNVNLISERHFSDAEEFDNPSDPFQLSWSNPRRSQYRHIPEFFYKKILESQFNARNPQK
jgi:hypothetical protein